MIFYYFFGVQSLGWNFGQRTGPHLWVVPSAGQNSAISEDGRLSIWGVSARISQRETQSADSPRILRGFSSDSPRIFDTRLPETQLLPGRNSPHNQNPSLNALGKKTAPIFGGNIIRVTSVQKVPSLPRTCQAKRHLSRSLLF